MSTHIRQSDLDSIRPFPYCAECGEVWETDHEQHAEECGGELETVYGFFVGGSCHHPVIFDDLGPGDRVAIVRGTEANNA